MDANVGEAGLREVSNTIGFGVGEARAAVDRLRHAPQRGADWAAKVVIQGFADQMHLSTGQ